MNFDLLRKKNPRHIQIEKILNANNFFFFIRLNFINKFKCFINIFTSRKELFHINLFDIRKKFFSISEIDENQKQLSDWILFYIDSFVNSEIYDVLYVILV